MVQVMLLRHGESLWNRENRFTGWTDVDLSVQGTEEAHRAIRALIRYLDDIPDDEIAGITIPTGLPLVYELDDALDPVRHYYLGDQAAIRRERASDSL